MQSTRLLCIGLLIITTQFTYLFAQPVSEKSDNYFFLKKDQMYLYSESGKTKLSDRVVLSNGMQVFPDGAFIRLNEARRTLQDGQYLDTNGKVYRTLADLQAQLEVHRMALRSECFRLSNGEIVHYKNGGPVKIMERVMLNHGITLYPDGLYMDALGKKFRLREGNCMDHAGRIYKNIQEFHLDVEKRNRIGKN